MIKFSLKASPDYKGTPRVREYFEFTVEGRPEVKIEGMVDDGIRKEWSKEYTEWKEYVDRHDTIMYEAAINEYLASKR
jgi:hypothetical protein